MLFVKDKYNVFCPPHFLLLLCHSGFHLHCTHWPHVYSPAWGIQRKIALGNLGLDSSFKLFNCYHLTFHALYDFCVLFIYGFMFYCFSLISSRYLGLFTDIRVRESLLSWIIPIPGCTGVYCLDSFLRFGYVFCSGCLISGSLLQTSLSLLPTLCQTIVHYCNHFIKIVPKCTRFWTPDCNIPWRSTLLSYWSKSTVNLPLAAKLMSLWRAVMLS